jgi:pyruvate formate lyase activating enzyme
VHNCQNWLTSQALRDPSAVRAPQDVTARELAALARQHGARIVTRPTTSRSSPAKWAVAVFREARAAGLVCSYVSNGNGTPEVLRLHPALGLALQGGPQELPRPPLPRAGGTLERVLWTIRSLARARHLGGDRDAARAGLQRLGRGAHGHRAVPRLRLTRHPVARDRVPQGLQDDGPADTSVRTLLRAAETGAREGCTSSTRGTSRARSGSGRTRAVRRAAPCSSSAAGSACSRTGSRTAFAIVPRVRV